VLQQCGAQSRAWPVAELGQRDHVGIVRRDFLSDAAEASSASVPDVPGEESHRKPY
jgi:hypothetical protein